jgi:hypothetical protein
MIGYSSIIGLFGVVDLDRGVGASQVRSTNFIFFVFVGNGCWVRFSDFIFFDFRSDFFSAFGLAKHRRLKPVPSLHACQRPFPAPVCCRFEAKEGFDRPGFIGQPPVRESEDRLAGFRRMDKPLTGDFLVDDAGFEVNDAQETAVCVEGGLDERVGIGIDGEVVRLGAGRHWNTRGNRDLLCVHAVAAAVAGGLLPTGGRDRSAGFGAVNPGGLDLTLRSHPGNIMHAGMGAGMRGRWGVGLFC